jgi:predicted class III extradiol MEMO1 family dioxygenase
MTDSRTRHLTQFDRRPVAVVDIGSNSIRLVVFDGTSRVPLPLFNEKVLCGLGRGLERTGALDAEGMQHLAALDGRAFAAYLQRTANTICGRKPLALLLDMLAVAHARGGARMCLDFVAYAQSAAVRSAQDSSVSYAAAALALRDDGAGGA